MRLSRIIERAELVEEARRVGISETLVRKLYDQGWRDAMAVAERTRLRESKQRETALVAVKTQMHRQIVEDMAARQRESFQKGFRAGQAQARPQARARTHERPRTPPSPPPSSGSRAILEQVEAQCRIIAESNPGMEPAINALRHRLKKLG